MVYSSIETNFNCKIVVGSAMMNYVTGADPGFPVGGREPVLGGGRGPPTQVLFVENVCKIERIGSGRGTCAGKFCM